MEVKQINGYSIKDEKAIRTYDTVALMQADSKLSEGQHVKTRGYYEINDGGASEYYITPTQSETEYQEILVNGLYGTLINKDINVKQFGAKGDGTTDDTQAIQSAINYTQRLNGRLYIPNGTYLISKVEVSENITIIGESTQKTILKSINNNSEDCILKLSNDSISGGKYCNFSIDGNKDNNINEIDGIVLYQNKYLETQNGGNTGDTFATLENIQIFNCSGNGVYTIIDRTTYSGLYMTEVTISNIQSVNNQKYGIYFTNRVTDSYLKNCTCIRNILSGFRADGSNTKFIDCKTFVNGRGDYRTLEDINRIPSTAFTEYNGDYDSTITFYTRDGNGSVHNPYVYYVFTGSEFEEGETYYTLTTPYYKKYPGFLINGSFCNMIQCEAQENFGDGIVITQPLANLSNIKCDNNGIIVAEGLPPLSQNQQSYESAGLTQLYYGVYLDNAFRSIIFGEFYNFRNNTTGKVQKAPLFINSGFQESGIITCNLQQYDQVFSKNSRGDVDVVCNTHPYIYTYDLSTIIPSASNTEIILDGDTGSYLKKIKDIIYYRFVIHGTNGDVTDSSTTERVIFTLPEGFRPPRLQTKISILAGSVGYSAPKYCDGIIYKNGKVAIRGNDSTSIAYAILEGCFPIN